MLIWELIFIRNTDQGQKIMFNPIIFENGLRKEKLLTNEQTIFYNYVSLFPNKDIVRIKLGLEGHYLYSFYYIDKTQYDLGFLGILGVSEYNENIPYDWPESEIIAKFIFAEYFKRLRAGLLISPNAWY